MSGRRFEWIADGGHAWLVVPVAMAREVAGISEYSYLAPNGRDAWLEEDCDAARFIAHYGLGDSDMRVGRYYDGYAPCHNYNRYGVAR